MQLRRAKVPILAALIALAAGPAFAGHGNQFASTTLSPSGQSGDVGTSFSVDIVFHDDPGSHAVFGIHAWLRFDPSILQATSVVNGAGSPFGNVIVNTIDNTNGLIEYRAEGGVVNGFTITAATITFEGIAAGTANLSFQNVNELISGFGPFGVNGLAVGGSIDVTSGPSQFFTDPLTGPDSPNLGPIDADYSYGVAGLDRVASDAGYDGFSSVDRPVIRTLSSGYLNTDFVAELTVTRTVADVGSTRDLIYFGFGEGAPNPSFFNEPTNAFGFRIHSSSSFYGVHAVVESGFSTPVFDSSNLTEIGQYNPSGTTFRIQKLGNDVTLSIVGQPGAAKTYSLSDLGAGVLDGSNGYIYFGNSVLGTTFSDFSVAPILIDTTPPVVTLNGADALTLECSIDTYVEPGATATDDQDGTVAVTVTGNVDASTPGDYTVTYTATDAAGNTGSATRTVHVVDTTPPVVTLNGAAELTLECSIDTYTEAGAAAVDACNGAAAVTVVGNVDPGTLGDYTITYSATDAAGNTGSASRIVHVVDTTAPDLTAALERVRGNGDHDDHDRGRKKDRDDDDHGRKKDRDDDDHDRGRKKDRDDDHGEDGGNRYRVVLAAADACDASPSISALIGHLNVGDATIRYKHNRKNRIKVQANKHGIRVTLKGPDQAALEALWAAAVEDSGFVVTDGQVVKLVDIRGRRGDDDDDNKGTMRFEFDGDLRLRAAFLPNPTLMAQATDASGNASTAQVVLPRRGHHRGSSKSVALQSVQPGDSALGNYPNPFNPSTTIYYTVAESAPVRLVVYSALGQQVRQLVNSHRQPGRYNVEWNGLDAAGQPVATGVYIYRLQVGQRVESGKMTLSR